MKKRIAVLILALLAMVASNAESATVGACPYLSYDVTAGSLTFVTVQCTAGAGGALTDVTLSDEVMEMLDGTYLYDVIAQPIGLTVPKTDSNLVLSDDIGLIFMTAAGNGLALIDDADTRHNFPETSAGLNFYYPITKERSIVIDYDGNDVAGAVTNITFVVDWDRH